MTPKGVVFTNQIQIELVCNKWCGMCADQRHSFVGDLLLYMYGLHMVAECFTG